MASVDSHTQTGYTELYDVTAKQSFLKSPELIGMTFFYLQFNKNDKIDRLCLLNVALTCKDFLDVALNALWEKLYSLVPLLKVLPDLQLEDGEYVLSGNLSQSDWDRLQYYSRKVKFFILEDDVDDLEVHPSTYFRIAQLQSSALFPSLRHLHYNLKNASISDPKIFFFLSPLLDSLDLYDIKILLLGHFWLPFPLRHSAGSSFSLDGCRWTFLKNLLSTSSSSDL